MKFKKLLKGQAVLRLIEDEISRDKYVKAGKFFVEKNAINDEYTHSYYARVLDIAENAHGIKPNDVVYLRKVYAREMLKDEMDCPFMVCSIINIIGKIHNFDPQKVFGT